MLFKYASHASALPSHPAVLEANILPFMIEPLPFSKDHSGTSLEEQLSKLSGKAEPCIGSEAFNILKEALEEALNHPLSKFQYKNLQDMFEKCSRGKGLLAVLNSPTGTGKTLVFFTYLLAKLISARISGKPMKALILYPRKALARDQLGKMLELLDKVNEMMIGRRLEPLRIAIYDGDRLRREQQGLHSLRDLKLRGHRLCHGFENGVYKVFLVKSDACDEGQRIEDINWVMDVGDDGVFEKADIVVTNHSMLTKLINDNFVRDDRMAFNKFVKGVGILILDEAHIYLGEALEVIVPTLLKLLYLKARLTGKTPNCIKELAEGLDVDFIVSSATLTDSDIIVKTVRDVMVGAREERLNSSNVIGFFKVKTRYGDVGIPAPLEEYLRTLLTKEVYDKFKTHNLLVYNDYDAIISEGIRDYIWKGHFKLRIALVSHPHPQKESWTSLAEILIAVLNWLNAIRLRGLSEKAQALVFIDSKETLKHIYRLFLERQILEAQDHADRTLLTGKYDESRSNNEPRDKAISAIIKSIDALIKQGRVKNTLDILYRETTFKDFQVLHLYITPQDLNKLKARINSYDDLMKTIENLRSYDGLKRLIDSLNDFADAFKQKGWHAYEDEDVNTLTELVKSSEHVILAHYGDLEPPQRAIIEGCMKGDRNPTPLVTLSTSTLELGVDIESLALTIQYASYPYPADLAQRFGRSGRHASSFFVSTLLLVLRNTGEDVRYVLDQDAVEYVYNLKIPPIAYVLEDVDAIVRSLAPTVLSHTLSSNQEDIVEGFLRMLGCEHDSYYNRRFREWRGLIIVAKSQSQVDNLNQVLDKASSVLARIGEHLNNRGLKDLRDEVVALKEELVAIKNLNRKGLHVNLIPYTVRLIALYETLKDQTQAIPHEFLNDIVGIIQDLVGYMQATLEPQLQDEALRFVISHIPPGATDAIGRVKVGHLVYSPKKKPELLSTNEAFKMIRPLRTGA
jgi:superfamily II DNA/RNA helicase